jgi:hypothetical protein
MSHTSQSPVRGGARQDSTTNSEHPASTAIAAPAQYQRRHRRRIISADILHAFASAIRREWDALDPADPRVRPTLAKLAFMRDADPIGERGAP